MTFSYNEEQCQTILNCISYDTYTETSGLSRKEIILGLESWANDYIWRIRTATEQAILERIRALDLVAGLLNRPADAAHNARINLEILAQKEELYLIQRKRERRSRKKFVVDVFGFFARSGGADIPLAEAVILSDSNTPAAEFFRSAIAPVCLAADEPIQMRQAITDWHAYQAEMQRAEIDLIRCELDYAMKGNIS
ncbi:hypothetical protein M8994_14370 [Brucella sp. 21LCYQ03]|nr:hypothetical protein [Brucella sp. 21LCYQ03]